MGITGLIPFLDKASAKVHLKDLQGCTVAVDTYCWLHKGVFCCADKLCRGEDTDKYVHFCLKYVSMLLSYDIKPILVFDGRHLPAKALTEKRRRELREQSKKRAAELLRMGKTDEARSHMRRCIDVTHEMALRLIKECRRRNVDCLVAPYEADAQMAFLNKVGIAQYIITEDSDLVLFGCKKIIFKMDLTGAGLLVDAEKLHLAMGLRADKYTFDKFRVMCILSGCDYLDSLPGIGLAKACKFILKTEEENMNRALRKIPQYLNMRHLEVGDEYIENFLRADATFKHMYVYNPLKRRMERLNSLSTWNTDERYCSNAGEILDDSIAFQLALGNLNPFSLKVLDTWNPDESEVLSNVKYTKHKSIWMSNFQLNSQNTKKSVFGDIGCALQFKKVTYFKTKEEENDEQRPEEDDIVSFYSGQDPPLKRRRYSDALTSPVQVTPTKKSYNPFPLVSPREKKPIFKLLIKPSPKKMSPTNPFKRSIFTTKTEVRSRFFALNVALAGEAEAIEIPVESERPKILVKSGNELLEEVTRIEVLSVKTRDKVTTLYDYNSPSPVKTSHVKSSNIEFSPTTSLRATKSEHIEDIPPSIDSGIGSLQPTESETSTQLSYDTHAFKADVKNEIITGEVIHLSDSEENQKSKYLPKKPLVQKSQKIGLAKLKKLKGASQKLPINQTRLSMFGFQKRSSLQ